jgi:glycoside/pentoside/hexuronide:cation symporter, GPH family
MSEKNYVIPVDERVSRGAKVGYAVGDFGANFLFQSVTIFLLYYFTDVFGITAAAAGWIFLLSKFWDAVTDPTMGYIADHTKSRWGQKRPYLLFGAVPLGLTLFFLFAAPDIQSYSMKVAYAAITFLAVLTFYTIVNVPYSAITANLTMDSRERANLTGYRMMGAIIGTLVVATLTKPLVGFFTDEITGFRALGIIYGIAIAVCTLITFFSVKERVRTHAEDNPGGISDIFKIIRSNPPMIYLFFGIFFLYACHFIFLASVAYFFKYCIQKESFIAIGFFCLYVPAGIMLPFLVTISNKLGKKTMFIGGMGIFAIGMIMLYFVQSYNLPLLIFIYIIIGLGLSAIYQGPWSMIPDTVEYTEWKIGLRRSGIIYGIFFFGMKLSAGVSAFIVGMLLASSGYVADATQTPEAQSMIRFVVTLLPVICYVLGAIFLFIYPINHKKHNQMVEEIMERSKKRKAEKETA